MKTINFYDSPHIQINIIYKLDLHSKIYSRVSCLLRFYWLCRFTQGHDTSIAIKLSNPLSLPNEWICHCKMTVSLKHGYGIAGFCNLCS